MKYRNWDRILWLHTLCFGWFLLFYLSLFGSGRIAAVLAIGNVMFLFGNIPLSLLSLVLIFRGRFSRRYNIPIAVLSILNTLVSIAVWSFVFSLQR